MNRSWLGCLIHNNTFTMASKTIMVMVKYLSNNYLKKEGRSNKPGSVSRNHSSRLIITNKLKQPTRVYCRDRISYACKATHKHLFGLAPSGVLPALAITN